MKNTGIFTIAAFAAFTGIANAADDCDSILWSEVSALKQATRDDLIEQHGGQSKNVPYLGGLEFFCSPIIGLKPAPDKDSIKYCFDEIVSVRANTDPRKQDGNALAFLKSQVDNLNKCDALKSASSLGLLFK